MTVTYNTIERVDLNAVRLGWASDESTPVPFRIYVCGVLVDSFESETQDCEILLTVPDGDAPYVEVLDKSCQNPSLAFPGRLTISWNAVSGAESYRVDEYVASVWTEQQEIAEDGSSSYLFVSRWLEDDTIHQFRVMPISAGNDGTALSFSVNMVRHPDPPIVSYVYNGAGTPTVTISSS